MSRYRIVEKHKPGYYKYYSVQERPLFFWWEDVRALDTLEEAKRWIKDKEVKETRRVVKTE